jgi:cytochrome P450
MTSRAPPAAPGPAHEGFLSPAFFQDPYPVYRKLLAESPIFWSRAIGAWVVCPFETVKQGLSDLRLVATGRIAAAASHFTAAERAELPTVMRMLDHWMNFQDPPMHTRIRRLVSKAFTPQTVAALEPKIERLVAELLERMPALTIRPPGPRYPELFAIRKPLALLVAAHDTA